MSRRQQPRSNAAGFTLIEILVAFAIATLFLAAFYQIFSTGLRGAAAGEGYSAAVLLAESALDERAGSSLVPGETSDRVGRYMRQTSVRLRPDLERPGLALAPYEIRAQVTWREGIRERTISLSTIRLGVLPEVPP